jgi:membrane dipeptidase
MKTLAALVASLALARLPLSSARAVADSESDSLYAHAIKLMSQSPLIDTHVDLPQIIRGLGMQPSITSLDLET